jgi:antitoxin component of MazEF toxin-antitoxin module
MDCAIITVKPKAVGNSVALFIPAETRKKMQLTSRDELVVHLHKKKKTAKALTELLALAGATKGKLGPWIREEDRLDAKRDS